MSKEAQSNQLSRRETLTWLAKRGGETAVLALSFNVFTGIRKNPPEVPEKQLPNVIESPKKTEGILKVKDFSEEIIYVSKQVVEYDPDDAIGELLGGFIAGNVLIGSMSIADRVLDKKIASVSSIPARMIDSLSTMVFATQMQDPRFKEYGFESYLAENNIIIPPNPTIDDVIKANLLTMPLLVAASWAAPAIGRGYLGMSPFVAKNNLAFASLIGKSLSLGGEVKNVINHGGGPEVVAQFLGDILAKTQTKSVTP